MKKHIMLAVMVLGCAPAQQASAECPEGYVAHKYTAKSTAYYPDNSPMEGGFVDRKGKPLQTLQDFLNGKADYVSVAMDSKAFPYGTKIFIPEMNKSFEKEIVFRVVDTGGAFKNKGTTRIDICVDNETLSLRPEVNRKLTLVHCVKE